MNASFFSLSTVCLSSFIYSLLEKNDTLVANEGSNKLALDPGKLVQIKGPEQLTEGDNFNLTCVLSPLLAYYEVWFKI